MIVKNILKEEILTLGEVRAILDEVKLKRSSETEELGYELRRSMRHAELFGPLQPSSKKMAQELLKLEKITPPIAVKIADILPQSKDELRAVYAKEKFSLSDEELDEILEIVFRG
jgi:DNA-directed RNA polymerase subunit F